MAERIRTDQNIAKDLVDSLSWDSRVDASNASVTVDRGIVTLTGTVPFYSSRVAAAEDAWLIRGVRAIENGTVFLNGTVASGSAKRAAYDTARYMSGVKEVKDHITVRIPVKTLQG
jgi:osmotically-inducible protein OsmY